MGKSNKEKASPVTKILIKKIHGDKEPANEYWKSEFNDENNERSKKSGPSITKQIVALLCGAIVGCAIVFAYKRPDIIENTYNSFLTSLKKLTQTEKYYPNITVAPNSTTKKEFQKQKAPEYRPTHDQIREIESNLLNKRKKVTPQNTAEFHSHDGKFQYEIEFFSGGKIYTDSVELTKDSVKFKSETGLLVAISRNEIKTLKKIPIE